MARAKQSKRATLRTVAELTGLSLSTVSLSLRDGSNVKPSTRRKVAEAAKLVGYVPNRAGVRLRTGRTNVLSLVLATDENSVDFTRMLIQGIGAHIQGTRYHLNVVPEFAVSDPVETVRHILENRTADGLILTHTQARDPRVQLLLDAGFPFVCHGRTEFYTPHAFHDLHAERFVDLAVKRLVDLGRKKFLLAAADNKTTTYTNMVMAFNRSIAAADVAGHITENSNVLGSASDARTYGRSLGKNCGDYDAIICNNELTALAIISGLQEGGNALGHDYDLICRQTTEILPTLYPKIDTVAENLFETGSELAKLLIRAVGGEDVTQLQTLREPVAIWRKTAP